jgi:hypothetical protein
VGLLGAKVLSTVWDQKVEIIKIYLNVSIITTKFNKEKFFECAMEGGKRDVRESFLVSVEPSAEMKKLDKKPEYDRSSPEEIALLHDEKTRIMEPVSHYLDGLGLEAGKDYQIKTSLSCVVAKLTPWEAEKLRREAYIKDVGREAPTELA